MANGFIDISGKVEVTLCFPEGSKTVEEAAEIAEGFFAWLAVKADEYLETRTIGGNTTYEITKTSGPGPDGPPTCVKCGLDRVVDPQGKCDFCAGRIETLRPHLKGL
jgi:hypothetical protein